MATVAERIIIGDIDKLSNGKQNDCAEVLDEYEKISNLNSSNPKYLDTISLQMLALIRVF